MRNIIKIVVTGLTPVLLLFLLPLNASAIGLGIAPTDLQITDALRGTEHQRMVTIFNPGEGEINVRLGAEGEASSWISFYQASDPSAPPIDSISIPGKGNTPVLVKIKIAPDAAIGSYKATVYAETIPPEGEEIEGRVTIKLRAPANVVITVTGTQILRGVVSSISARDVEAGHPLQIKVGFQNSGNVMATPQVGVAVTKDGAAIDSFTSVQNEVKPESRETISVEWDTTGRESGDYVAHVAVSLAGKTIGAEELNFAILPPGTLARAGVFEELGLEGEPNLGTIVKVQATFSNTGQIDTKASFIGEAYCDNELVDTLESEESLVPMGEKGALTSYVKLERPGHYDIKGYINYEGKKTDIKEISFTLAGTSPGRSFNLFSPIAIAVIVILVGAIAFMALRRRKAA